MGPEPVRGRAGPTQKGSSPLAGLLPFFSAEGARFELAVRGYRTLVFKTSSIGRSDNLPYPSSVS